MMYAESTIVAPIVFDNETARRVVEERIEQHLDRFSAYGKPRIVWNEVWIGSDEWEGGLTRAMQCTGIINTDKGPSEPS